MRDYPDEGSSQSNQQCSPPRHDHMIVRVDGKSPEWGSVTLAGTGSGRSPFPGRSPPTAAACGRDDLATIQDAILTIAGDQRRLRFLVSAGCGQLEGSQHANHTAAVREPELVLAPDGETRYVKGQGCGRCLSGSMDPPLSECSRPRHRSPSERRLSASSAGAGFAQPAGHTTAVRSRTVSTFTRRGIAGPKSPTSVPQSIATNGVTRSEPARSASLMAASRHTVCGRRAAVTPTVGRTIACQLYAGTTIYRGRRMARYHWCHSSRLPRSDFANRCHPRTCHATSPATPINTTHSTALPANESSRTDGSQAGR